MAKNSTGNPIQNNLGPKPTRKHGLDVMRLATLGGIVALLAVSFLTWRSIDQIQISVDSRLARIENRLGQVSGKVDTAMARSNQPQQQRGPDPNRVYTINTAGAPVKGLVTAPVTIAEFSDFQWPFCARVGPTLKKIEEVYGNKVRVVWKNLPLSFHQNALPAARAAAAADQQGKFWEFHDKLFANQTSLNNDNYRKYAKQLGLDMGKFGKDMSDSAGPAAKRIDADKAEADSLGVGGTPAFFVNGRYLSGAKPFEEFAKVIDAELARPK